MVYLMYIVPIMHIYYIHSEACILCNVPGTLYLYIIIHLKVNNVE